MTLLTLTCPAATNTVTVATLEADATRTATIAPAPVNPGGLVCYLPFEYEPYGYYMNGDFGYGWYSYLWNGYYGGTAFNCGWLNEGRYTGGAMSFNDYYSAIELPYLGDVPTWNAYSVSAWIKNFSGGRLADASSWYNYGDYHEWVISCGGGYFSWNVYHSYYDYDYWSWTSASCNLGTWIPNYMAEQWHHVVAVRDGTNAHLWVDGVLRDSRNDMFSPIRNPYNSSYNLYIGNSLSSYNSGSFYGQLDEFRIYNRALLPGEISQLYTHGTLGPSIATSADLTIAGSLTATGTVTFANAPPRLKPAGNLASGIYSQAPPVPGYSVWFDPADKSSITLANGNEVVSLANKGSLGGIATSVSGFPVKRDTSGLIFCAGTGPDYRLDFPRTPDLKTVFYIANTRKENGWWPLVASDSVQPTVCYPLRMGHLNPTQDAIFPSPIFSALSWVNDFGWYGSWGGSVPPTPVRVVDKNNPPMWRYRSDFLLLYHGKIAVGIRDHYPTRIDRILGSMATPVVANNFIAPGVGDILAWEKVLTDAEVESVVDWLWKKWGGNILGEKYLVANGQAAIAFPDLKDSNGDAFEIAYELVITKAGSARRLTGFSLGSIGYWGIATTGQFELNAGPSGPAASLNTKYNVRWFYNASTYTSTHQLIVTDGDGAAFSTISKSVAIPSQWLNWPFTVFAGDAVGSPSSWCDGFAFASVKIKRNGSLVSDCVAVEKGSTKWSSTPAPSNCFWDKVTKTYRVQTHGGGSFSIIER